MKIGNPFAILRVRKFKYFCLSGFIFVFYYMLYFLMFNIFVAKMGYYLYLLGDPDAQTEKQFKSATKKLFQLMQLEDKLESAGRQTLSIYNQT